MPLDCPPAPVEATDDIAAGPITESEADLLSDRALIRRILRMMDADPALRAGRETSYLSMVEQVTALERPITRGFPGGAPLGFHSAELVLRAEPTDRSAQLCTFTVLNVEFRPTVEVASYVFSTTPVAPASVDAVVRFAPIGEAAEGHRPGLCAEQDWTSADGMLAADADAAWRAIARLQSIKSRVKRDGGTGWLSCERLALADCRRAAAQALAVQLRAVRGCDGLIIGGTAPTLARDEGCLMLVGTVSSRWGFGASGWHIFIVHDAGAPDDIRRIIYNPWRLVQ